MALSYPQWPRNRDILNGPEISSMALRYRQWLEDIPNGPEISSMALRYRQWLEDIPNGLEISSMALKYPCGSTSWNLLPTPFRALSAPDI